MRRIRTGLLAALMLLPSASGSALEASKLNITGGVTGVHASIYGITSAPIGYVDYCSRNSTDCEPTHGSIQSIQLNSGSWTRLNEVNAFVNMQITPISDQEQYSVQELWTIPTKAGDCEDYVLLKKRYLEGLGFPAEALLITVVLDENGEGHAVLTVSTDQGDFVLDNRRNDVMRWSATGYKFLKRQSQSDPRVWVALTKGSTGRSKEVFGRN